MLAAGMHTIRGQYAHPVPPQALEKLLGFAAQPDLDAAARHLTAVTAELQRLRGSAGLAQHDPVVAACFDASVNRRKMAPTPPRSMPVGPPATSDTSDVKDGPVAAVYSTQNTVDIAI